MTMPELSANNIELLRLLNHYRYLTPPQLLRLGLVKDRFSVYKIVRRFSYGKRPHIGKKDFGFIAGKGRLPQIFYLMPRGAETLAEAMRMDEEEVHGLKLKPPFAQDYFHRMATVDFQIELDRFARRYDCQVPFFHTYFDTEGANRGTPPHERLRRLTKVPLGEYHLIPDAIFAVDDPDGKKHLFALEVYNGRDTKRVHRQLLKHLQAQAEGAIAFAYGLHLPYRVLLTFETENAMLAVINRIREDSRFTESEPYFAFNTLDAVKADFARGWRFFSGRRGDIFSAGRGGEKTARTAANSGAVNRAISNREPSPVG